MAISAFKLNQHLHRPFLVIAQKKMAYKEAVVRAVRGMAKCNAADN